MWLTLLSLLTLLGTTPSHAASDKAELQRLDEDIRLLVDKNAWSGVERVYLQMRELEAHGQHLGWEHHRWGAYAAQARGDVLATWQRLRAAEAVSSNEETLIWLTTLEATHGRAVVELSPLVFGEVAITPNEPLFDPGAVQTVTQASATLTRTRSFDGLLPLGRYRVGGVGFDIDGGPMVRIRVEPGQANARMADEPGRVRLVATSMPDRSGDFTRALAAARDAAAAVPGVATVQLVNVPGRRIYADFPPGSLEALGLTPSQVAEQLRAGLGIDTLPGPDSVSMPPTVGLTRAKGAELTLPTGVVTLGSVCALDEGPDRTAPPPGLLLELAPGADRDAVRQAVLASLGPNTLRLSSP